MAYSHNVKSRNFVDFGSLRLVNPSKVAQESIDSISNAYTAIYGREVPISARILKNLGHSGF